MTNFSFMYCWDSQHCLLWSRFTVKVFRLTQCILSLFIIYYVTLLRPSDHIHLVTSWHGQQGDGGGRWLSGVGAHRQPVCSCYRADTCHHNLRLPRWGICITHTAIITLPYNLVDTFLHDPCVFQFHVYLLTVASINGAYYDTFAVLVVIMCLSVVVFFIRCWKNYTPKLHINRTTQQTHCSYTQWIWRG